MKKILFSILLVFAMGMFVNDTLARSGCCSHHGGVCGCNNTTGMIRCCDGTDSPSCTCEGY